MTLHVQEDLPGVWWRSFKHINPLWCTSVCSRTGKCDELWLFDHRATFTFRGKVQKSGVWVPHALKPKPQKSANGHTYMSAFSLSISSWATSIIPIRYRYWDEKWCLYASIREKKEWLGPNKRRTCRKCSNFSTSFSSANGSTHYLQVAGLQYVNSSTTIELQIKYNNW